jgi:DNA-binding CsgD family transcriptional regulator
MRNSGKVPWPKLREYLFQVSSYETRQQFLHAACVEINRLIPFDETAGVFDTSDGRNLDGIGKSDTCTNAYNNYYRRRRPPVSNWIVNWRSFDVEYTVDFMFPNGMYKTLRYPVSGHPIYLCLKRSRLSPNFSDSDVDTLSVVDDYVNSLYSRFDKQGNRLSTTLSAEAIAEGLYCLTPREAEVCSLIVSRFNTAEIAAHLFISRRTVEKHVQTVFEKLNVRSREQLRWRLGVHPFSGIAQTSIAPNQNRRPPAKTDY